MNESNFVEKNRVSLHRKANIYKVTFVINVNTEKYVNIVRYVDELTHIKIPFKNIY